MVKYEVYVALFVVAVIFTIIDIVMSSCQLAIPSLVCSSITMILGFIGAYLGKTIQVEKTYNDAIEYIKKNFGIANIILSILDVLCCILAILTGMLIVMLVVRYAIAIRIVIYINKYKTVAFAVWCFVFIHLFKRLKRRKIVMTKNTILQNILATILAVFGIGGVVTYFIPEFTGIASEVTKYVAMFEEIVAVVSGIWLSQTHDQVLTDEEVKAKENKVFEKKAKKQAKAELKQAKELALKELTEKKMQEISKTEDAQIAKEV